MGVISKLAKVNKYETGANYSLGHSLSSSAVSTLFGTGGSKINVLTEYEGYAWKCINIRAETLSKEELFVERLTGGKYAKDINHEFNKILDGGVGQLDQSELIETWSKSMDMYGEAFFYYSKVVGRSKPFAIYPLAPSAMTVYVSGHRITGFLYQKDGERILLDLDEVDYWHISNPRHQFRGMGPMQAAGWFIRSTRYVTTYVNNFLENNAIPAGVIVAKGQVDDADWKLFKEAWASRYSGIDNAGKTGFVRGSDLDFVKTGLSLGEVDFSAIKESSREDIMVMFGISKPMAAIFDDINRASATVARQLFAESVTEPALQRLSRKISKKVVGWYGPQFRIGFSNPVPEDDEVKYNRLKIGVNRWITVNEARAADGLEPLGPEYDVIQVDNAAPIADTKSLGKVRIKLVNKTDFSYEIKESFRSEMEDMQIKYEKQYLKATNPILLDQKKRVIEQITPQKANDTQFSVEKEASILAEATLPILLGLAAEQGQLAATFAGNNDTKFELTDVIKNYIKASVAKSALSFTEDTQKLIAKALADGLEAGDSIADITKAIEKVYADVTGIKSPGYRIDRLARTEVIKASNEVTEAAYKQTGVVKRKEWLANPGACEFCKALNGSVIRLGGTYVPKGSTLEGEDGGTRLNDYEDVKHPPVHSNCRCALIPVIERAA